MVTSLSIMVCRFSRRSLCSGCSANYTHMVVAGLYEFNLATVIGDFSFEFMWFPACFLFYIGGVSFDIDSEHGTCARCSVNRLGIAFSFIFLDYDETVFIISIVHISRYIFIFIGVSVVILYGLFTVQIPSWLF